MTAPVAWIVAIGTELLLGDATDTNSAWLSARLSEMGVTVRRHVAVSDALGEMVAVLRQACADADVVLCTGGLGATQDDRTREALATLAGVAQVRDERMVAEIAAYFADRGRDMAALNRRQADLPEGGRWLHRVGTAPGVAIEVDGTLVCAMPGVPSEMRPMFETDVVPLLRVRGADRVTVTRTVRTSGMAESAVAEALAGLAEDLGDRQDLSLSFLASRGETRVRVTAVASHRQDALTATQPLVDRIVATLGDGVVGVDEEGVEHAIARRLRRNGWTLAVAESVTGGGVGARLVTVPGASDWFRGGLITYATDTKHLLAGVDVAVLEAEGPVSAAVAEALAVGVAERLRADVGLAVVGVAGPTTQGGRDLGHVTFGVRTPDAQVVSRSAEVPARDRLEAQGYTASYALNMLLRTLAV